MIQDTRFYIQLPDEPGGFSGLPPAVIEARLVPGGSPGTGTLSDPARQVLLFLAPPEVAIKHRASYADADGGFAEVDGPARILSTDEWIAAVARAADAKPVE